MATFTAKRSTPVGNIPGADATEVNLTLMDNTAGHVAEFVRLSPDDDHATFSTADATTVTWLQGLIAGAATEGITIVQTS